MTLRWKLVLLYALILTVVIGGFSVLLVTLVRRALLEGLDLELVARAKALGAAIEYENGAWRIDPESGLDRDYEHDLGLYYYVRDMTDEWSIVLASPLARSLWPGGGPSLDEILSEHPYEVVEYPSRPRDLWIQSHHYREAGVCVTPDEGPVAETRTDELGTRPGGHHSLVVHCGKDFAQTGIVVDKFVGGSLVLGPLVLLASLAGGWFLVSRALRPIDQMAHTARRISEADLARRIPVTTRDELGRLADTLNATFDRLQRGFERERQFTADASHELRTPLAAITGNVEVGLNKERPPAEYREILGDVGEAAARMQAIVEGLLALARSDEKAAPRAREKVVLARVVEDAVHAHRSLADQKQVSVSVSVPDDVAVPGDPVHLRTVVSNLVANAIRYNHDGGRVVVQVERLGATARIRIEDTGIGIPEKDLPHVFERFYRVDQSRSSAGGGGVGLGLAIAKAIVQAHHGTIAASRLPAGGSRFEVTLPT